MTHLLETKSLTKKFNHFVANDNISMAIHAHEIHALLGENGAGKSTFVKMLYGALQPNHGDILWQGRKVIIDNPDIARNLGITMVFQHFNLCDSLNVYENIALAVPQQKNLSEKIKDMTQAYGLPIDQQAVISDLSMGERQYVEIIRCLLQDPKLLIMDEPTAVLTPQESDKLFDILQELAHEKCAILYISHRLEEIKKLCHRATILRHGKLIKECDPKKETSQSLAQSMIGNHIKQPYKNQKTLSDKKVLLSCHHLSLDETLYFNNSLHHINLELYKGEILAIAGIAGNGQNALYNALSGEILCDEDMIIWHNDHDKNIAIGHRDINWRRQQHMAFIPEKRLNHGNISEYSLNDNLFLTYHHRHDDMMSYGFLNYHYAKQILQKIIHHFDVRTSQENPLASSLSGGNLQKYMVGRELNYSPHCVIVNQPTWGVDAGAASQIRQSLCDLAANGGSVLMISQDLEEIFTIADRVAVINRGYLSDIYDINAIDSEKIGLLMLENITV